MQHKTKNYIVLAIILILAATFLITSIEDPDKIKISGHAVDELRLLSCAYADRGNTCFTELERLNLITSDECCEETGLCCPIEGNIIVPPELQQCIDCGVNDYRDEKFISEYEQTRTSPIPLKGLNLPEGYSIIHTPFNVECTGPIELTTSIPSDYDDVNILKCKGELCYLKVIERTITAYQGDLILSVTKETEELKPEIIKLESEEITLNITSFKDLIERGGTQFYGEFFENLTKILYPAETETDGLTVIAGPFLFSKDETKEPVTIPFTLSKNIYGNAIGLFARKDNRWVPVGRAIDQETKTILANIQNISRSIGEDNISLAIMGVKIAPAQINFEKMYTPSQASRDAVILVHGLATTKETFKYLLQDIRLIGQPYQVWAFKYSSDRYIDEIADDLSNAIENNLDNYDRIFIVAHSMGGIIAQQALNNAYKKGDSYINKVKKAILIGTPNEGSIVAEAYEYLFSTLVHRSIGIHEIFHINERFIGDLTKGRIIERVPGIDYYVIAGTGRYTEGLIGLVSGRVDPETKFDGVVSVKSAQNIGGEYIDNMCKDYWEVGMTHMELVDDPVSRKIIGQIISEEVAKTREEVTGLGENKYYKIKIEECSPDIYYLAIGKKVEIDAAEESTLCSCGDGICGTGEDAYNCPSDCAQFFAKKYLKKLPWIIIITLVSLLIGLYAWVKIFKLPAGKHKLAENKNKTK